MEKIDKIFTDQAVKIREEYLSCLEQIDIDSLKLKECKEKLTYYLEQGDEINEKYKDSEDSQGFEKEINKVINKILKTLKNLEKKIEPYKKRVSELEKESDRLYVSIKERYPKLSEDEIKNQIISKLKR